MNVEERNKLLADLKAHFLLVPRHHYGPHPEITQRDLRGKQVWSAGYWWSKLGSNYASGATYDRWLGNGATPDEAVANAIAKLKREADRQNPPPNAA